MFLQFEFVRFRAKDCLGRGCVRRLLKAHGCKCTRLSDGTSHTYTSWLARIRLSWSATWLQDTLLVHLSQAENRSLLRD